MAACTEACQTQNNACFAKVCGGPNPNTATAKQDAPANAGPSAEPANPAPAAAALASDEQVKKPAKPTKTAKPAQQQRRLGRRLPGKSTEPCRAGATAPHPGLALCAAQSVRLSVTPPSRPGIARS